MSIPSRFVFHQKSGLVGLGRIAVASATAPLRRLLGGGEEGDESSREFRKKLPAPSPDLVRRYLEHLGVDPEDYAGEIPPHLFPQWTFDLLGKALSHLTYPLHEVVNGGCRLEINDAIAAGQRLTASAQLVEVKKLARRIRFHLVIKTGPQSAPDAVVAHMYNVLVRRTSVEPESGGGDEEESDDRDKGPAFVGADARELERWVLSEDAGLDFAKLTGDFNPIHWLAPAARAFGFENTILHGFSTMARAYEGLVSGYLEGEERISVLDVRFTKPLVLPHDVGLYVESSEEGDSTEVFVGDRPGDPAYLIGDVETSRGDST